MSGYSTKNKTFRSGELKDANVTVIGDGYGAKANFAQVDECGRLHVHTVEGAPQHFNGTVGTSAIDITPDGYSSQILIKNPKSNDCACELQVSFNGGTDFFTIERRASLCIDTEVNSFKLKANQAGCSYEILVTAK